MPHALIVDDDVDALAGLEELMVHEGFTTATAVNLKQARERMALQRPDVVLLDLMLPDGDGMDLFQDVESRATTEVVLGSAMARLALRSSCRRGAKQELTEQVHTWEEEGGNVPDVPTVTPRLESSRFEPSSRTS
jgi:two-component system, NtrC family, response regulator HydG